MVKINRLPQSAAKEPLQVTNALGEVYIKLFHHKHFIEAKWQGHLTSDDVINAAEAYLAYIKRFPFNKLLNDKSEVTGDWQEANAWLEFEWLPQVLDAGLCCITHIYSNDMLSQLSARDLYLQASPYLQIQNFSDREQATDWLLSCKPSNRAVAS